MSSFGKTLQITECKLLIANFAAGSSNSRFAIFILQFAILSSAYAAERSTVRSPVSPKDSLQHLVVTDGLKVELVAHEPNVIDPVAVRFDENGRMWVVEMRDYPNNAVSGEHARSRISVLDDRNGDGFYETAAVFADNLKFATGVQPWKGGVFVTMAGKVAYMKDSDGDNKADVIETWYTGFSEGNTQLRANHPRLALDNHIYIANGLRGGNIVDARSPKAEPVSISGMDFRFDPFSRKFEPVSGVGQFGLTFDDYGNRFVCSNRNPAMHIVLEDRYLKKNPLVAVAAVATDVAKAGADSKLFPIGRSWTTSHLHANQFTAACAVEIYRGDALPPAFYGNILVCDPTAHLVHREIMKPKGVTFSSAPAEKGVEFLASRDEWFSPVNLENGPDGALYVVDMYRAVIEHPEWMPTELRKRPDLLEGIDRGRIYRVVPKTFRWPAPVRLSELSGEKLAESLAHPNAWRRETAARLLFERQDKSVITQLIQTASANKSRFARIHALWLLRGLAYPRLDDKLLLQLLDDDDARIVEQAIVAADSRRDRKQNLPKRIASLATHDDARVRFQALLTATPKPPVPTRPADRWELDAILIASGKRGGEVLERMLNVPEQLEKNIEKPTNFIIDLARLAAATKDDAQLSMAIRALVRSPTYGFAGITSLLTEASRRGITLTDIRMELDEKTRLRLNRTFDDARNIAADAGRSKSARTSAVDLLAFSGEATETLATLALGDASQAVRLRAIAALAKQDQIDPWQRLLAGFSRETPAIQRAILDAAATNAECAKLVLGEIIAGRIKPTEIDLKSANVLLQKLFSEALPQDREKALAEYQGVLKMSSDPSRGRGIFEKHCAICHRIDNVGTDVAPDISDSREKLPEQLLTDIIQPNRAIDSNYFSYTATTKEGLTHTGILAAETSTSVTLKQAEGKTIILPRDQVDELQSDGVSLMPDGLEKNIPPQDMADLIAFIKNWRYLNEGPSLGR
jgi:putative membrane-bound dehydrogenase-like protein